MVWAPEYPVGGLLRPYRGSANSESFLEPLWIKSSPDACKTAIQAGTWYRVDATYRANDVIVLYVNRAPEASVPIPGVTRDPNTGPITVGQNATFHGRFFQGLIDEVSLRNRALSAAEVAAAHSPKGPEAGLIAAYSFDCDARDRSGSGHDGQLLGGARFEPPGAPDN